jgi:hypothetical protein
VRCKFADGVSRLARDSAFIIKTIARNSFERVSFRHSFVSNQQQARRTADVFADSSPINAHPRYLEAQANSGTSKKPGKAARSGSRCNKN